MGTSCIAHDFQVVPQSFIICFDETLSLVSVVTEFLGLYSLRAECGVVYIHDSRAISLRPDCGPHKQECSERDRRELISAGAGQV